MYESAINSSSFDSLIKMKNTKNLHQPRRRNLSNILSLCFKFMNNCIKYNFG